MSVTCKSCGEHTPQTLEELAVKVREVVTKDTKLYENMLVYKVQVKLRVK